MNSSRRYERNACFYLWFYRKGFTNPQMQAFPINEMITLPLSSKQYKTTLKNIKTYLDELFQVDDTIIRCEIERATHVGSKVRGDLNGSQKD